jgi:hypothetical protein
MISSLGGFDSYLEEMAALGARSEFSEACPPELRLKHDTDEVEIAWSCVAGAHNERGTPCTKLVDRATDATAVSQSRHSPRNSGARTEQPQIEGQILLIRSWRKRSNRFLAEFRARAAASGERVIAGPEKAVYRGGTGPYSAVKGNGTSRRPRQSGRPNRAPLSTLGPASAAGIFGSPSRLESTRDMGGSDVTGRLRLRSGSSRLSCRSHAPDAYGRRRFSSCFRVSTADGRPRLPDADACPGVGDALRIQLAPLRRRTRPQ